MVKKTLGLILGLLIIAAMLLSACSPQTITSSSTPDNATSTKRAPTAVAPTAPSPNSTTETGIPSGNPPLGTPPTGTPPSGNPPEGGSGGNLPTGTPPNGTPPSGTPLAGGPGGTPPNGSLPTPPNSGSDSGTAVTGTAAYSQSGGTVSRSNETITASGQDESAIKITDNGSYTLTNSTISTTGNSSSMDSSSFYGLNAAVLVESGSKITLSNVKITTTGSGANGVFATGEGSTIDLTDVTIDCTNTGAHGVDATLSGTLNLTNVDIATAGNGASAAVATDRGGGTINVTGGTVLTTGTKSPPIYSTGIITVTGADMKATNSEAVVVEGKNSVILNNTTIAGAKNWGVIIYQSMSGDAEVGAGSFTMIGGTLTAEEGPLFYSTNTRSVIDLQGAELIDPSGILLKAGAGDWGTGGSNGADVTFTADNEILNGSIICDSLSSVSFTLKNGTTFKGAVNAEHTAKSVLLTLDNTSIWEVGGTSYLTGLTDTDTGLANIHSNGYTVYYDASNSINSWLNGQTYDLTGGGILTPAA
jgi:hypothetical protein